MNILDIGNSFSQDATTYLHDIAEADGYDLTVVNLYIGGCSLQRHWENIENDSHIYDYELNGRAIRGEVSIYKTLQERRWDYIALQQVSGKSGIKDSYYPYIDLIADYIKKHAPTAKLAIHETWAYELDSEHPDFAYYGSQGNMYLAIKDAYGYVADRMKVKIIPCGDVIQKLRSHPLFDYARGGQSLCRDGFHMDFVYGRYLTAAVWYVTLTKRSISGNKFITPAIGDTTVDREKITVIKQCVDDML